jgi:hypothetical protein
MTDFYDDTEEPAGTTEQVLRALTAKFSMAPLRNGKRMRDLLDGDLEGFRTAAVSVLRDPGDTRGCRYLVTLLWTHELLIPILGDFTLPKALNISIGRTAANVDTQLHIRLIQFLVSGMLEGREVEEQCVNRLLEVLGSVTDGFGIQGFLRQMLQHPNPRIRSKVTLLVGTGGQGIRAIRKLLQDPGEDPRVRANAVEALWSYHQDDVVEVFRDSLRDLNNRVTGNAAFGLYLAGDPQSISAIRAMAEHADRRFRETALWVMGRTEDSRFLPFLGRQLGESTGDLRKAVFRSLASIKRAAGAREKNPPLAVHVFEIQQTGEGRTQVRLVLPPRENAEPPQVLPTGFAIEASGRPVEPYTCVERRSDHFSVAFVLPRRPGVGDPLRSQIRKALTTCLATKRAGDRWSIFRYRETHSATAYAAFQMFGQTIPGAPLVESRNGHAFTGNAAALRLEIDAQGLLLEKEVNAFEAIRSAVGLVVPSRSARHVVVVVDCFQEIDEETLDGLIETVRKKGFFVHGICTAQNSQIHRLCSESSGTFHLVADGDGVESRIALIYHALRSHWLLEFQTANSESSRTERLVIRVHNATSCGQTEVGLYRAAPDESGLSEPELVEFLN